MRHDVSSIIQDRKDDILSGIRSVISDEGYDGAVLFTSHFRSVGGPTFLEYFGGFSAIARRNLLFVPADGQPVLLVDMPSDVPRLEDQSWISDIRGSSRMTAEVEAVLEELAMTEVVGVHGFDQVGRSLYRAFDAHVGLEQEDFTPFAYGNTQAELELFEELGRIADAGFEALIDNAIPGLREYQLAAIVESRMRTEGSLENFNLLFTGTMGNGMRAPTDRVIERGDLIEYEISPMYRGYSLQLCRTIAVGQPDDLVREKFDLLETALERAHRSIGAGVEASVIASSMNAVFAEAGYSEYCRPPYMRTRGHAFGIERIGHTINEDTTDALESGMVLVVHPNQYLPETGYLVLGDPVMIEHGGAEKLTATKSELYVNDV